MATARALQYARTLDPDELRAVHFTLDGRCPELVAEWGRLGWLAASRRRGRRRPAAGRAVLELAAETVADGETE